MTRLRLLIALVVITAGCQPADVRPRLGQVVAGKGLVIGLTETSNSRWSVEIRLSGDSLCTTWDSYAQTRPDEMPGGGCSNEWVGLLKPDRASPVFIELIGGFSTPNNTFIEGITGIGVARAVLDFGAGEVEPPLVDLAPLSLSGRGFAIALPGRVEIRAVRGFDAEGGQILSQTL